MMEREYLLGRAPATGDDSRVQCIHFKGLIRAQIGREMPGVSLEMRNSEVVALCDMKKPKAEEWALRAVGHAPRIWNEVLYGKYGITR